LAMPRLRSIGGDKSQTCLITASWYNSGAASEKM
jgi:hypothetical protein